MCSALSVGTIILAAMGPLSFPLVDKIKGLLFPKVSLALDLS